MQDATKKSYGQVHPVFALSHAFMISGQPRFLDGALTAYDHYHAHFHDGMFSGSPAAGTYLPNRTGDLPATVSYLRNVRDEQNQIIGQEIDVDERDVDYMTHWLESLSTLYDGVGPDHPRRAKVADRANAVGNHIVHTMFQETACSDGGCGYMPWSYNADWSPVVEAYDPFNWWRPYARVSTGHNLEVAFLLSRAVERGFGDPSAQCR